MSQPALPQSPTSLIWSRVIWRQWRCQPKVPLVLILILSLGVAVFLSIRLANRAAVTGFSLFTESISGDSDLLVRPRAGTFPETDLATLRQAVGSTPAVIYPVLDTTAAATTAADSAIYRIIGTDFVALSNGIYLTDDDSTAAIAGDSESFAEVLGRDDQAYVSPALGLDTGETLSLSVEGIALQLTVAGVLQSDPLRPPLPDNLLVLDLPGAQRLTGHTGYLSRLEVRIPPGPDFQKNLEIAQAQLTQWAGERYVVETPGQRKESATQMSAAFRLNLTILSTLALVVGAYLILQAMEASVIKRRSEIAILRCLGVTPRQIHHAWLTESLMLGAIGSLLGIAIGCGLAQGMVRAISATVNTLYYETTASSAAFDTSEAAIAFGYGMIISLVAGWLPAREASRVSPAHAVNQGTRGGGLPILRHPWLGLVVTALAYLSAKLPPFTSSSGDLIPIGGYLSAFFFLVGLSILAGWLFPVVTRLLHSTRSATRRYAASQFRLPEGRHRLAAAGLLTAFGMSAAMGILICSFQHTLTAWIQQMLKADIYIAAAGDQSVVSDNKIAEPIWQKIIQTPGIEGYDRLRRYGIDYQGRDTWLAGSDYSESGRHLQLIWIDPPTDLAPNALRTMQGDLYPAWVSESFARRFQVGKSDQLQLPTPAGEKTVIIAGIYADYGSERGTVLVSRDYTTEWYADTSVNNIAVYLAPGTDENRWLADFKKAYPSIVARTNRKLRDDTLLLFKQTFSVTYALEAIAVIIAVTGLGLAMVGLLLERRAELSTLKELGLSRQQIAIAAMWEGVGLSLVGVVGGLVLSLLLGWLLVYVVNVQSFGWTLTFRVPWLSFVLLSAAMVATGGIVAWLVGKKVAVLASDRSQ